MLAAGLRYLRAAASACSRPPTEAAATRTWMHGRVELSEVHWPNDRSQLRLVCANGGVDAVAGPTLQSDGEADAVEALCDAWRALAVLACRTLGRGVESEDTALEATLDASALDVFYYPPCSDGDGGVAGGASEDGAWACAAHTDASMLTLLVADTPDGLECRDPRGVWVAVPLGRGRCALLAGRSALVDSADHRNVGSHGVGTTCPCEHRVRKQTEPGLARLSISLDVYAAGTKLPHT